MGRSTPPISLAWPRASTRPARIGGMATSTSTAKSTPWTSTCWRAILGKSCLLIRWARSSRSRRPPCRLSARCFLHVERDQNLRAEAFCFIIVTTLIRRHVLIFHQAALGDFVVTWPIAVALGRMFPQSRISYVTHASKGQLASRVIGVESMDVEQGWHLLHAENASLPESNT